MAGELVGRCANAIARPPTKRLATMGLRCCAGPVNTANVQFALKGTLGIDQMKAPEALHEGWEPVLRSSMGVAANQFARAWAWTPVFNEELVMIVACDGGGSKACSLAIGRYLEGTPSLITTIDIGQATRLPDVTRIGDARHLRLRGLDPAGTFGRDISYVYGRVVIGTTSRP